MKERFFTKMLMNWHLNNNERVMPWKGEKDPYKIWLSEVILQQTRVEQGWDYYERFIEKYPDINKLANAQDADVFKLWKGLGYYNRCRNLLFTARCIVHEKKGIFPKNYEEILALKGVGNYTAAAIASFAFNLPYAVVDGNVFRVLARFFGVEIPTDSSSGKKFFSELAQKVLDKKNPAAYNQAIMDFGATICKPFFPLCSHCPLQKNCFAFKKGLVNHLPVKQKSIAKKNRWFTYFLFEFENKIFIQRRTANDIWQNLTEFYLVETPDKKKWREEEVKDFLPKQFNIKNAIVENISEIFKQQLTHQNITGQFIKIKLKKNPSFLKSYELVDVKKLNRLAFPQFINQYLKTSRFSQ